MDRNGNKLVIETAREADDLRGMIEEQYRPYKLPGSDVRLAPPRRNPYVENDSEVLDEIARGNTEVLPFELRPSTSKLAIAGLRQAANMKPTNADESVVSERARKQLIHVNLPINPQR